ncbi:MAG TPA: nucleotidyltransferase domain-containing protein [Candidatus Bilamarchaeaceae archaeon]|nr:nucleotidyltransferase domain-containing protein [Candidatus Bilamarchaeaceae archaeon]
MKGPLSRKGSRGLLSLLLEYPKRKFSISELAKCAKVPFGSAWNIIQDWEASRIVETERVGSTVIVTLGGGPYLEVAKKISGMPPSPHRMALAAIGRRMKAKGVKSAFLFGSVAEGRERPESDIDIALVKARGFDSAAEMLAVHGKYSVNAVFLEFANEKEMLEFLAGKKHERMV